MAYKNKKYYFNTLISELTKIGLIELANEYKENYDKNTIRVLKYTLDKLSVNDLKDNKCETTHCLNEHAKGRKKCNTCRSRLWVEKNRVAKCWHNIKRSAKKRSLPFEISLSEFKELIKNTGYMQNKGRLSDDLTIDRDKPHLGYIPGNLIVMTKRANVKKYHEKEKQEVYPF